MKKTLIIVVIAIIAVIGIGATAFSISKGVFDPYEQQIKLGYKFLAEGQYEEAILAFDKAITIEAKRDKAYIGKADTYLAISGEDMVTMINESLKTGYALTHSERIVDTYINIAEELLVKENYDLALNLLQKGYEVTGNGKLKDKIAEIIDKTSLAFMKKLFELCESGNIDEVKNIMQIDEFKQKAAYATEFDPVFYSPTSSSKAKSGKGIGIYKNVKGEHFVNKAEYSVYYGDYADNMRVGYGMWLQITDNYEYFFKGQWANDKPNGKGKVIYNSDSYNYEITGTYKDGLEYGSMTKEGYDGRTEQGAFRYHYTVSNGIANTIRDGTHADNELGTNSIFFGTLDGVANTQGVYGFY